MTTFSKPLGIPIHATRRLDTQEDQKIITELIFCLDQTGSISDEVWKNDIKPVLHDLITGYVNEKVALGIIKFAETAEVECDITTDRDRLHQSVNDMSRTCGHPENVGRALDKSEELFNNSKVPADLKNRAILILTDGQITRDGDEPYALKRGEEVRKKGIDLLLLGVGDVNRKFLKMIASPRKDFILSTYKELKDSFSIILNKVDQLKEEVTLHDCTYDHTFGEGEDIFVNVELFNSGSQDVGRFRLECLENDYFQSSFVIFNGIKKDEFINKTLHIRVKSRADLEYLPRIIKFRVIKEGLFLRKSIVSLEMGLFFRNIIDYSSMYLKKGLRAGLCGPAGVGKSSFANTMIKIFKNNYRSAVAYTGKSSRSVTDTVQEYRIEYLFSEDSKLKTPLLIRDVWGQELTSEVEIPFDTRVLKLYAQGRLKVGFQASRDRIQFMKSLDEIEKVDQDDPLDCICIMCCVESTYSEPFMKDLLTYTKYVEEVLHRACFIVITKVDTLDENEREDEKERIVKQLTNGQLGGINASRVFFVRNILNEQRGTDDYFESEKSVILLFKNILENVHEKFKQHYASQETIEETTSQGSSRLSTPKSLKDPAADFYVPSYEESLEKRIITFKPILQNSSKKPRGRAFSVERKWTREQLIEQIEKRFNIDDGSDIFIDLGDEEVAIDDVEALFTQYASVKHVMVGI